MKEEIVFKAGIEFKGSIEEFQKVAADLQRLCTDGRVMIDTVPLPERPSDKARGLMIDTVPLPELGVEGLMIGTWPTPEKAGGVIIDAIPFRPRPLPGIPVAKLVSRDFLNRITKGMPRVKISKDIYGGMRNPHLHIGNEIALLSRERFREFVGQVAMKLSKELLR